MIQYHHNTYFPNRIKDCQLCDNSIPKKYNTPIPIYDFEDKQIKMFLMPKFLRKTIEESIYEIGDYDSKRHIIHVVKDKNGKYDIKIIKRKSCFGKFIDIAIKYIKKLFN